MAKHSDARKPKAETPKGFRDYFGAEVAERREMLAKISAVYELYGFDALETSAVETVEALGKFLPDVDRPNEGVFAWLEDADWLALRYDLTAPLARVYAQHRQDLPTPYRRYAMGPVWRNEKPGPGRFRQFYQCDADTVGAASVAADAEICAMLADVLEAVGIARGDYVVKVNNRKVLNGILEKAKLLDPLDPERYALKRGIVLRAIDKKDRIGSAGVRELLRTGRKDESGDFTKGADLTDEQVEIIMEFVDAKFGTLVLTRINLATAILEDNSGLEEAMRLAISYLIGEEIDSDSLNHARGAASSQYLNYLGKILDGWETGTEGVRELVELFNLLAPSGPARQQVVIDPTVVRGLGYYTGSVFEAELTFDITDDKGRKQQFGSVAGGGRYDDLVKRFTGQEVPATGVSIGVDRLLAALRAKELEKGEATKKWSGPVVVTVMDRDRMADYQAMVADLRNANIRAEVYLGNPKQFGNQLKYADKRGSPVAVIQGADELARGVVQIKDLILGAQMAANASLEEWKIRPSQYEVPREGFEKHVQSILDAHKK